MRNNSGQSLFEVVVALAISTLVVIAIVSLATNSIKNASFSKNKTVASRYAQEATEWLRGQRDADPAAFAAKSPGIWCMQSLTLSVSGACPAGSLIDNIFKREVTLSNNTVIVGGVNKTLIVADVVVSWEGPNTLHTIKNSTEFADWRQR